MTDQEMIKLCAAALDHTLWHYNGHWNEEYATTSEMPIRVIGIEDQDYDPLHDDAQAMALVKKFPVECSTAIEDWGNKQLAGDLNRAIVECVAKMQNVTPAAEGKE